MKFLHLMYLELLSSHVAVHLLYKGIKIYSEHKVNISFRLLCSGSAQGSWGVGNEARGMVAGAKGEASSSHEESSGMYLMLERDTRPLHAYIKPISEQIYNFYKTGH